MLNEMYFSLPPEIDAALDDEVASWVVEGNTDRVWERDASLWSNEDEAKWLGWLDIVDEELGNAERYESLRGDIEAAGYTNVLLMGMGGSSLCPEVLSITFGKTQFHILDSTVPAQIQTVESRIDLEKTLFIVASKSGSTLEPNCFKQYFFERLAERVGRENAGKQFIAITDPGSKMEQVAKADGFRHIFYGKPEVGGRFSALSAFGMTAAASMGLDIRKFLKSAAEMVEACRSDDPTENFGVILGILLAVCHANGSDKLTIFTSAELNDLGAWLEQLIAESTGKNGVAIIPVDREPVLADEAIEKYSHDRVFVFLGLHKNRRLEEQYNKFTAAGFPAVWIRMESIDDLGQEFFRWEFATAVAGSIMGINPFNQPDVEAAKIETRKLTDEYEKTGELPDETAFHDENGIKLYTGENYAVTLSDAAAENSLKNLIDAHLSQAGEGDYFAILAYIEMNEEHERILTEIRSRILARTGAATCLGFGPRFLHSTGQAYKGGGNNGVFLQITSDDAVDLPVPGQKYTFGVVKSAQARGDFQVLVDRGRRALRVHLGPDVTDQLEKLASMII